MEVYEAIRTKGAIRNFTDQPILEEAIRKILNAGRRAQSSKNIQPWTFIAIRDKDMLKRISECGKYANHLAGAALGVALVSPKPDNDFDLGQAAACMQLAAWEMGIGSCIGSMWEPDKAKAILGIPAELHFDTAISFGYPAPDQRRPDVVRGSGRKPLEEVVRWKKW